MFKSGDDNEITPTCHIVSSGLKQFLSDCRRVAFIEYPAFRSSEYSDFMSFHEATSAVEFFTSIYCIYPESVNHMSFSFRVFSYLKGILFYDRVWGKKRYSDEIVYFVFEIQVVKCQKV